MEIESFFPGRIRVRSDVFRDADKSAAALAMLSNQPGIKDIAVNARTGSLTVVYDAAIVSLDSLMRAKVELERLEQPSQDVLDTGVGDSA